MTAVDMAFSLESSRGSDYLIEAWSKPDQKLDARHGRGRPLHRHDVLAAVDRGALGPDFRIRNVFIELHAFIDHAVRPDLDDPVGDRVDELVVMA